MVAVCGAVFRVVLFPFPFPLEVIVGMSAGGPVLAGMLKCMESSNSEPLPSWEAWEEVAATED